MRKPKDLTTREYIARVNEINGYFALFPPYEEGQQLANDELLDLLEFGVPHLWQREFWRQGWDPIEHSVAEFTEFCERLEFSENIQDETFSNSKKRPRANSDRKGDNGNSQLKITPSGKSHKSNKWCEYHQTSSHDTGECKVILAQARRMRNAWENRSEWPSKRRDNDSANNNELNSIVKTAVKLLCNKKRKPVLKKTAILKK